MSPRTGLASVNFFLADVEGGLGPFLATFLAGAGWSPERVGWVMTIAGLVGLAFNGPAGALVDRAGHPRGLMGLATMVIVIGTLALLPAHAFASVLASQIGVAIAAALMPPALTALTLGIVGKASFPFQQGRNQAWNHGGNVLASGLIAWLAGGSGRVAVFWVLAAMALASGLSLLLIPARAVDPVRARGTREIAQRASLRSILEDRRVLLVCAGLTLFHLANAAMLPLLGERVAKVGHGDATRWLAICVIVAQVAMTGVALAASWAADRIDRAWLFVIPCMVLPVRTAMAAFAWAPAWLLPIQVMDACGAGLLGVSVPILIADYTWGSGRTQTALGTANTFQGIGASLSNVFGGMLMMRIGWTWGFLGLGAPSLGALAMSLLLLRLSGPDGQASRRPAGASASPTIAAFSPAARSASRQDTARLGATAASRPPEV